MLLWAVIVGACGSSKSATSPSPTPGPSPGPAPAGTRYSLSGVVIGYDAAPLAGAAAASLGLWLLIALGIWLVSLALDVTISFPASFLIVMYLVVGVAVPVPAGVGSFHFMYQLAATSVLGAGREPGQPFVGGTEGREEKDGRVLATGLEGLHHVATVGVGQTDVHEDHVEVRRRGEQAQRLPAVVTDAQQQVVTVRPDQRDPAVEFVASAAFDLLQQPRGEDGGVRTRALGRHRGAVLDLRVVAAHGATRLISFER